MPGVPPRPWSTSEHEPADFHRPCGIHADGEVGGRVVVVVALDQPEGPLILPAKLPRSAIEGGGADEGKCVVCRRAGDGIDGRAG